MRGAVDGHRFQPVVAADAVILMHDQIAGGDFGGVRDELVGAAAALGRPGDALAEQILLRHHRQPVGDEAAFQAEHRERDAALRQSPRRIGIFDILDVPNAVLAQHQRQALPRPRTPGGDHHGAPGRRPALAQLGKPIKRGQWLPGQNRPRPAADIHPLRAIRLAERRERKHRPRQRRIPGRLVQIQHVRRNRPVRLLARPRRPAALGKMIRDQLQPRRNRILRPEIQADRRRRQVVENRLHPLREERRVMLNPRMPMTLGHRQIQGILDRFRPKQIPPGRPEPADRRLIKRQFRRRMKIQAFYRLAAALRLRIEPANRLDRVAEQINPHRRRLARRKHVDDPATQRILARLHHRAGAIIPVRIQKPGQILRRNHRPHRQRHPGTHQRLARRHLLQRRIHRRQHNPLLRRLRLQPAQRRNPLRNNRAIRRNPVIRHAVPGRELLTTSTSGPKNPICLGQCRQPPVSSRAICSTGPSCSPSRRTSKAASTPSGTPWTVIIGMGPGSDPRGLCPLDPSQGLSPWNPVRVGEERGLVLAFQTARS